MSKKIEATGQCLCGDVKLQASAMSPEVGACHCGSCRKWGGGPLLAVDCNTQLTIVAGEQHVTIFNSSDWAERGFCSQCGTHLYYRLKQSGQYIVPVGVFDETPELNFDHQIFIDKKPDYYAFANETKNMTGEQVFAQFSGN